jgi:hypothetical protein
VETIEAATTGKITPADATAVLGALEGYRRLFEITEIEARLTALEKAAAK